MRSWDSFEEASFGGVSQFLCGGHVDAPQSLHGGGRFPGLGCLGRPAGAADTFRLTGVDAPAMTLGLKGEADTVPVGWRGGYYRRSYRPVFSSYYRRGFYRGYYYPRYFNFGSHDRPTFRLLLPAGLLGPRLLPAVVLPGSVLQQLSDDRRRGCHAERHHPTAKEPHLCAAAAAGDAAAPHENSAG